MDLQLCLVVSLQLIHLSFDLVDALHSGRLNLLQSLCLSSFGLSTTISTSIQSSESAMLNHLLIPLLDQLPKYSGVILLRLRLRRLLALCWLIAVAHVHPGRGLCRDSTLGLGRRHLVSGFCLVFVSFDVVAD